MALIYTRTFSTGHCEGKGLPRPFHACTQGNTEIALLLTSPLDGGGYWTYHCSENIPSVSYFYSPEPGFVADSFPDMPHLDSECGKCIGEPGLWDVILRH
jgi:hypothetical protein